MEDLDSLLESHVCAAGNCSRGSHTQHLLVSAADVATPLDELRTLVNVRECLTERGFQMAEMEPTPRFATPDAEPKPWALQYSAVVRRVPGGAAPDAADGRKGWFSALLERW